MFLFKSKEQSDVNTATDKMNLSDDWAAYLYISDNIRIAPDGGRKYLKAIMKNVQHREEKVACSALTLLGSCMSNDDIGRFHDVVAESAALSILGKLGRKSKYHSIRDKSLGLIRNWAEGFSQAGTHSIFGKYYRSMIRAGTSFPKPDTAPVLTPKASHDTNPNTPQRTHEEKSSDPLDSATPQYITKLRNDFIALILYVNCARDNLKPYCLTEGKKAEEKKEGKNAKEEKEGDKGREKILTEIRRPLLEIKSRLQQLITSLENEIMVDVSLKLNDEVHRTLELITNIEQGKECKCLEMAQLPHALKGEEAKREEKKKQAPGKPNEDDPFAALADRRHQEAKAEKDGNILGLFAYDTPQPSAKPSAKGSTGETAPQQGQLNLEELFDTSASPQQQEPKQVTEDQLNDVLDLSDMNNTS
ncbi:hypothetical protein AAMO2058_001151300 [Amorphochlora amoebiformis]|uniref:VHS domain-containing protein n=1 Tax=Amorphochlora amoebiformis TaxID=1561963 RepID=A0A7S0GP44_9EUKA|mmetsp:Transcript_12474/g.19823  ORF Transcript_12474/g.19823 Transcript_12474/m.19823 type:complete len:418 (+) Transcript_12474:115-1368(+)